MKASWRERVLGLDQSTRSTSAALFALSNEAAEIYVGSAYTDDVCSSIVLPEYAFGTAAEAVVARELPRSSPAKPTDAVTKEISKVRRILSDLLQSLDLLLK